MREEHDDAGGGDGEPKHDGGGGPEGKGGREGDQQAEVALRQGVRGFRGVSWDKGEGKYSALIKVSGELRHIGFFDDEVQAALAYDAAAKELLSATRWQLNLPPPEV